MMTIEALADSEGISRQAVWKIIGKLEMRDELILGGSGGIFLSDKQADKIRKYHRRKQPAASGAENESRQTISDLREDRDSADQIISNLLEQLDRKDKEIQALRKALDSSSALLDNSLKTINNLLAALDAAQNRGGK